MSDSGRNAMTPRERRRKTLLLIVLLILLALLSYGAYYFWQNRRLPLPGLEQPKAMLQPPRYLYSFSGSGENHLSDPVGITIGKNERVYVVDFGRRRISAFTKEGRFLFFFDQVKSANGNKLRNPVHLATAPNGEIWLTDRRLREVFAFAPDGTFLRAFAAKGLDRTWSPLAIAVSADDVYLSDVGTTTRHSVLYLKKDGTIRKDFGKTEQVTSVGDSPGNFYFPNGIALAPDGRVFVCDGDNQRIQIFDQEGAFLKFIIPQGIPRGIAIDAEKRLYVVNALAHQVDIYDLDGTLLTTFGSQGVGPGQFNFPNDVAVDGSKIFITDRSNDQVQVWGWPIAEPPVVALPDSPLGYALCLSPLPLIFFFWTRRRRHLVVTHDFVMEMIDRGLVHEMKQPRLAWVVPEDEHEQYRDLKAEGVDLFELLEPDRHSESDVTAIIKRLEIDREAAILVSMADRVNGLCTTDEELRRYAVLQGVPVYDTDAYLETFTPRRREARG